MTAALFPLPGCVPRPSPPTDAKTLRDGGTAPYQDVPVVFDKWKVVPL